MNFKLLQAGHAVKAAALSSRHVRSDNKDNQMTVFQNQFVVDDVSKIIKEAIEQTIGGNSYMHDKVNNWTGAVVENCLGVLTKQQKPYKYIGKYVHSRQKKNESSSMMVRACIN